MNAHMGASLQPNMKQLQFKTGENIHLESHTFKSVFKNNCQTSSTTRLSRIIQNYTVQCDVSFGEEHTAVDTDELDITA